MSKGQINLTDQLSIEAVLTALNCVSDAIVIIKNNGRIEYANQVAEQTFGVRSGCEQIISHILKFVDLHSGEELQPSLIQLLTPSFYSEIEKNCNLVSASGASIPFSINVEAIYERKGGNHPVYHVVRLTDNSLTQQLSDSINFHRSHDLLTGLANRYEFEAQLKRSLQEASTTKANHCICIINLDQLQLINQSAGHIAGDEFLKVIAKEFQAVIRVNDILARLGNNEFALLLWRVNIDIAQQIAQKLINCLKAIQFEWDNHEYIVTCSIGIAEVDAKVDAWTELVRRADLACNEAKKQGTNQLRCYSKIEKEAEAQKFEVEWVSSIVSAVRNNKFLLYQQPIISLSANKEYSSCEVLLRMQDDSGGVINPGVCLLAAEKYDMINMIDRWVVHQAFYWLAENRTHSIDHLNINLSGISVTRDDFLQFIHDLAESLLVPTEKVCFEITETAAVENLGKAKQFIVSVKQMGCRIALDDFGSGMCSFSYLKNLPVDFVKIDGEFVREIHYDPVSRSMVEAINSVCQRMGIETIAEYVESKEIMDVLVDIGVNYAQGFGIAEPSPLSKIIETASNYPHHKASIN